MGRLITSTADKGTLMQLDNSACAFNFAIQFSTVSPENRVYIPMAIFSHNSAYAFTIAIQLYTISPKNRVYI